MSQETYVPCLFNLFRQHGYDGATLSKISAATGLGKASLYHHFPGGKEDMVAAVLTYSDRWLEQNAIALLAGAGSTRERLEQMCDRVSALYAGGTQPCVLAVLQAGSGRDSVREPIKAVLQRWIAAIAAVLIEDGMEATLAQQRGEDAIVAIQGALMAAQALDKPELFQRVLHALPQNLTQAPQI